MRWTHALLPLALVAFAAPAQAASEIAFAEDWYAGDWVDAEWGVAAGTERFVERAKADAVGGIADYGPFRVLDDGRAALVGATDRNSPAEFAAMLRDHPGIALLELVECPGTFDDGANLRLGRMIRESGIATHVPADGSVRSGAVELFIAGARRTIDDGASFAVHSWEDYSGFEAGDFSAAAPQNRRYLSYYREMGMADEEARAFYAMTNSVPHEDALWLTADDMRLWVATDDTPRLAYLAVLDLDLGLLLN